MIKEFFKKYILENIIWKIISLFLAIIIWTIALNFDNPINTVPFSRPLEIRGLSNMEADGIVLLNQSSISGSLTAVDISFRENVNIASNEVVTFIDLSIIDLEEIDGITDIILPVLYEVNTVFSENVFSVNVSREVILQLDRVETLSLPIHVNIGGEFTDGLDMDGAVPSPSHIAVTGPTSYLDLIHVILINLNASEITEDYADSHSFIVVDETGANITNRFSFDQDTVFLSMGLTRSATIPISAPRFVGNVAPGFTMGAFTVSMSSVRINGKPLAVSEMSLLNLGEINISGLTENTTFTIDLRNLLPEDVSIEGDYLVSVFVNIDPVILPPLNLSENSEDGEEEDEEIEDYDIAGEEYYQIGEEQHYENNDYEYVDPIIEPEIEDEEIEKIEEIEEIEEGDDV